VHSYQYIGNNVLIAYVTVVAKAGIDTGFGLGVGVDFSFMSSAPTVYSKNRLDMAFDFAESASVV